MDRAKETITDFADKVAAGVRSDHHKSNTQEAFDKTRREKDYQTGNNDSPLDKVCPTTRHFRLKEPGAK